MATINIITGTAKESFFLPYYDTEATEGIAPGWGNGYWQLLKVEVGQRVRIIGDSLQLYAPNGTTYGTMYNCSNLFTTAEAAIFWIKNKYVNQDYSTTARQAIQH